MRARKCDRARRDHPGNRPEALRDARASARQHRGRIVDDRRARAGDDRFGDPQRIERPVDIADAVEDQVVRRQLEPRLIAFRDEGVQTHDAVVEERMGHDVAAVRGQQQQHVDRRPLAVVRRDPHDRLDERQLAVLELGIGVASRAIQQREREMQVRVLGTHAQAREVRRLGAGDVAVFEQRVAEVHVRHRFVRMLDDGLRMEGAGDDAFAVHVQERTEVGQRAEMRRIAGQEIAVGPLRLGIAREIFQAAGTAEQQREIVRILGQERVDPRQRFLIGEALRADAHRHRVHEPIIGAPRRRDYASTRFAPTKVKNGSRSPEKNAVMSPTIAPQPSAVSA